jgi:hypothetical protein
MSTEPLLPPPPYASSTRDGVNTPATSVIQSLSLLIFSGSAIISTFWAWRSNTTSDLVSVCPTSSTLLVSFYLLESTSVSATPTVLCVSLPGSRILLLGRLPCIHLLRCSRRTKSAEKGHHLDVRYWKANIGWCTHWLVPFIQKLIPRLSTAELDSGVSGSSSMVGFLVGCRMFAFERAEIGSTPMS